VSSAAVQPIVALLSHPVGGNPAQYMIEKAFLHHDLDWRYLTFEVTPEDLEDAIRGIRAMGFRGAHCGNPHKQAVIPLLDRIGETAAMVGAVNLIFRDDGQLVGENTEGKGLLAALERLGEVAEKRIVLLGAGRAARAAGVELAAAGVGQITVVDRNEQNARELVDLLAEKFQLDAAAVAWEDRYRVPEDADALINATSIAEEDPLTEVPVELDSLRPELVVAGLAAYSPETWLIRQAAERGCTTLDGLRMYIDQVAFCLKLWTGVEPDCGVMREAIEEFLEL